MCLLRIDRRPNVVTTLAVTIIIIVLWLRRQQADVAHLSTAARGSDERTRTNEFFRDNFTLLFSRLAGSPFV